MAPWNGIAAAAVIVLISAAAATGCARSRASSPHDVLSQYARALDDGRADEAYALLSDDAKRSLPIEAFRRMVLENRQEARQIAEAVTRPSGPPRVTAIVTAPGGESLLLVYEDGAWRLDATAVDLYSQETPEATVRSFIRALKNKRWDLLLRFVPEAELEGLTAKQLERTWGGEQREEMEKLVEALHSAMPTARFETVGERATMAYGAGGTVELVREAGVWKVEELR